MNRALILMALLGVLAGCGDGNPFTEDETPTEPGDGDGDGDGDGGSGLNIGGVDLPPGTGTPTRNARIFRYEERNDNGGGYAEDFEYDSDTDTFYVDNLAFDGENTYSRGTAVRSLGANNSYAVYEAEEVFDDFLTGNPINQIVPYRAIVGISRNDSDNTVVGPRTSFAIVRTGGYVDYGFGGFVYQREGSVVMPTTGQAQFTGDYAGMRVFDGRGGLEYTEGDMRMEIDFEDPNQNFGVKGIVTNRIAFEANGDPISVGTLPGQLPLPDIRFVLDGDGNLNANGEAAGGVVSEYFDPEIEQDVDYEEGTYYAILAGDTTQPNGGEVVGIIVMESIDPRFENVTAQETGGFILYRMEN